MSNHLQRRAGKDRDESQRACNEGRVDPTAQHCNNMVAGMIIDTVRLRGISVTVFRIVTPRPGWGVTANDPSTGEWWRIRTDEALDAACLLATAVGLERG